MPEKTEKEAGSGIRILTKADKPDEATLVISRRIKLKLITPDSKSIGKLTVDPETGTITLQSSRLWK